jgi:hypothetical protein
MGQFGDVNTENISKQVQIKSEDFCNREATLRTLTWPKSQGLNEKLYILYVGSERALEILKKKYNFIGLDNKNAIVNSFFVTLNKKNLFHASLLRHDVLHLLNKTNNTTNLLRECNRHKSPNDFMKGLIAGYTVCIAYHKEDGEWEYTNQDASKDKDYQNHKSIRVITHRQVKMYLNTLNANLKSNKI